MAKPTRKPSEDATSSTSRKRARCRDTSDRGATSASTSENNDQERPFEKRKVSWPRRLEQGASGGHPDHRNQSPNRSALHHRNEEEDFEDWQASHDGSDEDMSDADTLFTSRPSTGVSQPSVKRKGSKTYVVELPLDEMDLEDVVHLPHKASKASAGPSSPQKKGHDQPSLFEGLPPYDPNFVPDIDSLRTDEAKDHAVCAALHTLRLRIQMYATDFGGAAVGDVMEKLLVPSNEKLIRYIGCLAIGGQGKEEGWAQLLRDGICRRALVCGIISRALKETVFSELWFGASDAERDELSKMERQDTATDGFYRTAQRAEKCIGYVHKGQKGTKAAIHLAKAKAKLVLQLEQLLEPMRSLTAPNRTPKHLLQSGIADIVSFAGDISRLMRQIDNIVYYWPPTFKDEEFEPARMECFNLRHMIENSPYQKTMDHGRVQAVLQPDQMGRREAIVRVVAFPGLMAYQKGGGPLGRKTLEDEDRWQAGLHMPPDVQRQHRRIGDDVITVESGFRTKVICKAVVQLQWGRQRLLTREAGTSAYLDAIRNDPGKYARDSEDFEELHDIFTRRVHNGSRPPSRRAGHH